MKRLEYEHYKKDESMLKDTAWCMIIGFAYGIALWFLFRG